MLQDRIVLGALQFGSVVRGPDLALILDRAHEVGFRKIDCAVSYGSGQARNSIGEYHRRTGRYFEIWEKIGIQVLSSPLGHTRLEISFGDSREVINDLRKTLHEFAIDTLDVLQIHAPPSAQETESLVEALVTLRAMRLTKRIGIANFELSEVENFERYLGQSGLSIEANQVHFNAAEQRALAEMIPGMSMRGIDTLANRVWARGLLSHPDLASSDRVTRSSRIRNHWARDNEHFASVRYCFESCSSRPVSELVAAWTLSRSYLWGIVVGVRDLDQLEALVRVVTDPVSTEVLRDIDLLLEESRGKSSSERPSSLFDQNY